MTRAAVAAVAPLVSAVASSVMFVALQVPVGDLWAARARESAAANGVGLDYWFGWFGGASAPGAYSVVVPFLSALVGSAVLGAIATVAVTALCPAAMRGASHPLAGTWVATVAAGLNLWSGRIAFAVGTSLALGAVVAIRRNRTVLAASAAVAATLASPVAGVLLAVGLSGLLVVPRHRRRVTAVAMVATLGTLAVLARAYGSTGIEPFGWTTARALALALCLMVIARPRGYVVVPVVVSVLICFVLAVMPTALGSNFDRMVWIWLPPAVVATARRGAAAALGCVAFGLYLGLMTTTADLTTAFGPVARTDQYGPLLAQLDRMPGLKDYRLEAVPDGTHDAAYFLLNHAQLARGYETQVDDALNGTIMGATLSLTQYRAWLDANAVGYVLLHRHTVYANVEYRLVAAGAPYLRQVWANADWQLLAVAHPRPIVTPPAHVVDADQATLVLDVSRPATVRLNLRWSQSLDSDAPPGVVTQLRPDAAGWTVLRTSRAGLVSVSG